MSLVTPLATVLKIECAQAVDSDPSMCRTPRRSGLVGLVAFASGLGLAIDVEQGSFVQWDVAVRRLD
jgi:hypothetical protein